MRDPVTATSRICEELLSIAWEPDMAQPYATAAVKSFKAARSFATTDPKLLRRQTIDSALADKWREVVPPSPLQPLTKVAAKLFDYQLAPELPNEFVWLARTPAHVAPVVVIHDFTGTLWAFDALAGSLRAPCIGIQCSMHLIDGCASMRELASRYVRLLPHTARQPVRLIAYSLGCRIAYHMACALEQEGESVQLVLLDGPIGPESELTPPRFGGLAPQIAERLHSLARGSRMPAAHRSRTSPIVNTADESEQLDGIVTMLATAGSDSADVAASLLELPDRDVGLVPPTTVSALYVSAHSSPNRTNGTVELAQGQLPRLQHTTVPGGHFDFIKQGTEDIALHVNRFLGL